MGLRIVPPAREVAGFEKLAAEHREEPATIDARITGECRLGRGFEPGQRRLGELFLQPVRGGIVDAEPAIELVESKLAGILRESLERLARDEDHATL